MDKNEITAMYLRHTGPRTIDMRPRFNEKTYGCILEITAESKIPRNVVVMTIVESWLAENENLTPAQKMRKLLHIVAAA